MTAILRTLFCATAIGLISTPALGTPFVMPEATINIGVGEVKQISLTLEPSGFHVGAFNLVFGVVGNAGLELVAVDKASSLLGSVDLVGGQFSISGEFADAARVTAVLLGSVTVKGLAAGGQLLLLGRSNVTDFDTFLNAPISGAIVTVIPEPGTMALLGMGLIVIGFHRRR